MEEKDLSLIYVSRPTVHRRFVWKNINHCEAVECRRVRASMTEGVMLNLVDVGGKLNVTAICKHRTFVSVSVEAGYRSPLFHILVLLLPVDSCY